MTIVANAHAGVILTGRFLPAAASYAADVAAFVARLQALGREHGFTAVVPVFFEEGAWLVVAIVPARAVGGAATSVERLGQALGGLATDAVAVAAPDLAFDRGPKKAVGAFVPKDEA